ncbi:lytic transglycosylase domain-containing protein [Arsenophonus nasoniae]|uniref:Lytic murein transglycosylase n=1 Tax=Arsenophonus nasoniae TaxID=638 RepID=D2TYM0_9GAMM|nr:lytic transglycosylase domain-containing protein [Arsenophonus nasoniae]QBY43972.1 Transglycosylase SLT domain protein [Arsenophonus nasoniae]WGM04290.1 lytic transglycosylase domain-containing protein [Arsenophonus nasoniae]WGM09392.1 lytic transglycosylase domain-containing protein [Arsenophonus nasoniae]WGM14117.1 lytic transglycosylase domain-containing protein [Arsenophonus nasoniae]CBA72516.1 lytic murein transglycosylase [Arsenophonus nasoniae]
MANSVPVLTIDIDDSKIKRLEDVAKQFHDAFNTMPSGSIPSGRPRGGYIPGKEKWNNKWISAHEKDIQYSPLFKKSGTNEFDKFFNNLSKASKEASKSLKELNKTLKQTANVAGGLFSTTLSWGVKLAAFGAIGTGGFGLIAKGAANSLLSPQGRGISVAQQQAINVAFGGRISGINSIINDLSRAKYDVNSPTRRALLSQGINYNNNAFENIGPYLQSVLRIADQHQGAGAQLNALQSMGFNITADQLNQLQANRNRLPQFIQEMQANAGVFESQAPDSTYRGYQDLVANFTKNTYQLSNSFLTTLSKLNPGLQKFSDAITKGLTTFISGPNGEALFETIGNGLSSLAKWLGSDNFQKDLKSFVELIKALVKAISDAVKWISGVFGEVDRAKNSGFVQGNIWQGVKESYYYANDLVNKGLKNVGDLLFPSAKAATTNAVLNNIIGTESNWNNSKINKKSGAIGLGQILPSTAKLYGFDIERLKTDPEYNYYASKKIFEDNLKRYNGDYAKSLAQYNGGNKAVMGNSLNLNNETINYLLKILRAVPEAAAQHPGLIDALTSAQSQSSIPGNGKNRFIIQLETVDTPGADSNLQIRSQKQVAY